MRHGVHGGSVVLGAVLGAGVVAGLGAIGETERAVDRFEIDAVGTGTGGYHAYVLDTTTGQVWTDTSDKFAKTKIGNGL